MIVAAAAELFRKKSYRGTSIEDIGAAVGTTGPALYRHFASKEAILVELLERAVRRSQRDILGVLQRRLPPLEALTEIVRKSVDHVIEETDLVAMADQEARSLSPAARERVARERRAIVNAWIEAVQELRPELSEAEVRSVCVAVFALIISLPRGGGLPPAIARPLYTGMAMAALVARPMA
jgi:AcrR family transcriptional regulator